MIGTSRTLRLIGYWRNETHPEFPDPTTLVDESWAEDERNDVVLHLQRGLVARAFMGPSTCRICGELIGNEEWTDGVYAWPEGLAHYVRQHSIRLPAAFVRHVQEQVRATDDLEMDLAWWIQSAGGAE